RIGHQRARGGITPLCMALVLIFMMPNTASEPDCYSKEQSDVARMDIGHGTNPAGPSRSFT
ncbi:MAG: hypothetical protein KDC00_02770, partial [Flavobacteriales bacterium]|nr:hypothetical protein [Flavobacteriales bacterium]